MESDSDGFRALSDENTFDIHCAAHIGDIYFINSVISRKNLNRLNRDGWTPLMYASSSQHEQIVKLLLKNGASAVILGKNGLTPIMVACRNAPCRLVDLLVQSTLSKIDSIEIRDNNGWTSLFHATYMGQEDTVKYLIHCGANVLAKDENQRTVLDIAKSMNHDMGYKIFTILRDAVVSTETKTGFKSNYLSPVSDQKYLFYIFKSLNIEKYWKVFSDRGISFSNFLRLTESDLINFGIRLLGPRRKLVAAITEMNKIYFQQKEDND